MLTKAERTKMMHEWEAKWRIAVIRPAGRSYGEVVVYVAGARLADPQHLYPTEHMVAQVALAVQAGLKY
jgi:hypothetical protein